LSKYFKIFLVIEMLVAFSGITVLWLMGSLMSFISVFIMLEVPFSETGSVSKFFDALKIVFVFLAWTVAGGLGLYGVYQLTMKVVLPERHLSYKKVRVFIGIGIFAVLPVLYGSIIDVEPSALIFLVPVIAAFHLLYLGREYVFPRSINN